MIRALTALVETVGWSAVLNELAVVARARPTSMKGRNLTDLADTLEDLAAIYNQPLCPEQPGKYQTTKGN